MTIFIPAISNLENRNSNLIAENFLGAAYQKLLSMEGINSIFSISGQEVIAEDLSGKSGLLPAFAWFADSLHESASGVKLGIPYKEDPNSLIGFQVNLSNINETRSELLLYLLDAFYECRRSLPSCSIHPGAVDISILIDMCKKDLTEKFELNKNINRPS